MNVLSVLLYLHVKPLDEAGTPKAGETTVSSGVK